MFTGIIEAVGRVVDARDRSGVRWFRIEAAAGLLNGLATGASVSVDGACFTAAEVYPDGFAAEAVSTTLTRTIAGGYQEGSRVNLERAAVVGGRLDGHLVQGHIDGVGHLRTIRHVEGTRLLEVSVPPIVLEHTIAHGSLALNGVSLTVNGLAAESRVEVALIPHTWEATNLRFLSPGDPLNVEGDLIGKYVAKLLQHKDNRYEGGSADAL